MYTDTHLVRTQLDLLQSRIEDHPGLLDEEFDQDFDDLRREFEELRSLLDH